MHIGSRSLLPINQHLSRSKIMDQPVYAPSQWETTLHCNVVSHRLGSYTKWSFRITYNSSINSTNDGIDCDAHPNRKPHRWKWKINKHHDDVIKWKHFPRYWPFVRGIHRSPVNSPQKGQWRGALMFSLIWAWINCRVNTREAGDKRRHRAHYDVRVMILSHTQGRVSFLIGLKLLRIQ